MIKRALFSLAGLAMALPALAQEAAEHGAEHAEPSLFSGDPGNAIWTVVIFVLVLVVLGKFAWGPILGSLQTRENFIREALERAKRDRDESEARLREYEERLGQARAEATAIVEEGRRDAEATRRRIEAEAQAEADRRLERAKREIQIATDTAKQELFQMSARLATEAASRVVGRELTPQDHERLIREAIQDIQGMSH